MFPVEERLAILERRSETSGSRKTMTSDEQSDRQTDAADRIEIRKWRLSDATAYQLLQRSYPVEMPLNASVILWKPGGSFPELGEILIAFEDEFGPSSEKYDHYKQSFSFPFLLEAKMGDQTLHFVWNLWDYKGAIDFRFWRMIERREDLEKPPDAISADAGVSPDDFAYIVSFLVGWIEGFVKARCQCLPTKQPFFRSIPASLTVYGFDTETFFYTDFQDPQAFDERVAELTKKFPPKLAIPADPSERIADTKSWIEKAKRESGS